MYPGIPAEMTQTVIQMMVYFFQRWPACSLGISYAKPCLINRAGAVVRLRHSENAGQRPVRKCLSKGADFKSVVGE